MKARADGARKIVKSSQLCEEAGKCHGDSAALAYCSEQVAAQDGEELIQD